MRAQLLVHPLFISRTVGLCSSSVTLGWLSQRVATATSPQPLMHRSVNHARDSMKPRHPPSACDDSPSHPALIEPERCWIKPQKESLSAKVNEENTVQYEENTELSILKITSILADISIQSDIYL